MSAHSVKRKRIRWALFPTMVIIVTMFAYFVIGLLNYSLGETPSQSSNGIITEKIYKPASVYKQRIKGAGGKSGIGHNEIPIPESYHLSIEIEGWREPVGYSANIVDAKQYEPGQLVKVIYTKKQMFFFSEPQITVLDIEQVSSRMEQDGTDAAFETQKDAIR